MALDDILFGFQTILDASSPVYFTNTYFGMPMQSDGRLLSIGSGRAAFHAPRTQILSMRNNQMTFIDSDLLAATVKAELTGIDWARSVVEMGDFQYVESSIGRRSSARVQPGQPIQVNLFSQNDNSSCASIVNIEEISINGLAILIERAVYNARQYGKGKQIFLQYHLPVLENDDRQTIIRYDGIVRNVLLDKQCRIGLEVYPDIGTRRMITKYLARRKSTLLKEIETLCSEEVLPGEGAHA